jgi:Zn-finger nucleic acid-binding protein
MEDHPYRGAASGPRCPLDGTRLREETHASGEIVNRCSACHGSWLPDDALTKTLRWAQRKPADPGLVAEPRAALVTAMARQKHRDPLKCPSCGVELIAEERGSHSYVLVDVCPEGCGTWLDDEELRRLIDHARGVPRS